MSDVPQIKQLPPAPNRNMQEDEYAQTADTFVAALPDFGDEANAVAVFINDVVDTVKDIPAAEAYKGPWITLSGPLNIPASVEHLGTIYFLVSNLDDVTNYEPGVSNRWLPIVTGGAGTLSVGQAVLTAKGIPLLGDYLKLDGSVYQNADYPNLSQLLPGSALETLEIVSGTPALPGDGYSLVADENYVYVGHSGSPFLTVIDKSDWTVVTGTPALAGVPYGMFIDAEYIYVAHEKSPFVTIINRSDLNVVSGVPAVTSTANDICADADYVYVAHNGGNGFSVIDKSNWTIVSGTPSLPDRGEAIAVDEDYVYIGRRGTGYFSVIDKSNWTIVSGTPAIPNLVNGVAQDENYVYLVFTTTPHLWVLQKGSLSRISGTPTLAGYADCVFVDDKYVYVGHNGSPFLTIIDKSDWSVVSDAPALPSRAYGVFADSDYVYTAIIGSPPYLTVLGPGLSETEFVVPDLPDPDPSLEWRIKAI